MWRPEVNFKEFQNFKGQAPEVSFEMVTLSTFLARYGVGGGATRRMPKGALMSGFEKPPRGRRLCPRARAVEFMV